VRPPEHSPEHLTEGIAQAFGSDRARFDLLACSHDRRGGGASEPHQAPGAESGDRGAARSQLVASPRALRRQRQDPRGDAVQRHHLVHAAGGDGLFGHAEDHA